MNTSPSAACLAPGFRFHPTDEELVYYYLRRKICGKALLFDAISEIDIYKIEPWDVPGKSRIQSRDMEWYFFSGLDKKYGRSQRTNRATEKGYWKTTGKEREVYHRSNVVGMKKTLVYHFGRAPRGQRTNWVMHEYKLVHQDALVLCRIFQKSGRGPKNGEQYGAPLIEEEWGNEDFELPTMMNKGKVELGDNTPVATPLPSDFHPGNNISFVESRTCSTNGIQNFVVNDQPDTYEMPPYPHSFDDSLVQQDSFIGSSTDPGELEFVLDESFWDASENLQFGDADLFETDDLMDPIAAANTLCSPFHDVNNDSYGNTDIFNDVMTEASKQPLACQKDVNVENHQAFPLSKQHKHHAIKTVASSVEKEPEKVASDGQYAFLQKASKILGSIPAPPAFGAEFPGNHAALRLNSVHITADVIQVKRIIFSFGLSRGYINSSAKSATAMARGWTSIVLFSFLALTVSFKLGALICRY